MVKDTAHHALILAGGLGTRLWPLSRQLEPKQFLSINSGDSLLEQTVRRIAPLFPEERRWIIIKPCQMERLKTMNCFRRDRIIVEPEPRGTAAAICLGVAHVSAVCPGGLLTVMPSDHLIDDDTGFRETVGGGALWAGERGMMVLYGIMPSRAETAYGYMERGELLGETSGRTFYSIRKFHEKPDSERAAFYLEAGSFVWNSGIFTFPLDMFMELLKACQSKLSAGASALANAVKRGDGEQAVYAGFDDSSIDKALIEKIPGSWPGIAVTLCDFDWHDMGIWETYFSTSSRDVHGNVITDNSIGIDCRDSMLLSDDGNTVIGAIGLENMVVVARENAVLVCPRDRLGDVGRIVEELRARGMKDYI